MNPQIIKSYKAAAAIAGLLIVKWSAPTTATTVTTAAAATDPLAGIIDSQGAASGGMADLTIAGLADVLLGGTVAAGDPLTSDANGKAVKCNPAAGAKAAYVAFALSAGVSGDIIPVNVSPGYLTTPV
ncbi:DUF2190 domain-containing protein [Kaistia algarum]|uniref:DUF2190 domain-containing protein n=1 Tax=Kaistia algarum TaxID=2083279 RepID=UPI000CE7CE19|nr:DUF2190 domain-containing protein [Kaistia algarum]MCX5512272.1 hypothetical protein [Kaistia algarum]PPE80363.1 DUF2190 domain-containing protein [Kaistia algarum]